MPCTSSLSTGRDLQDQHLILLLHTALNPLPSAVLEVLHLQFYSPPSTCSSVTPHQSCLASVFQTFSSILPLLFSPRCYFQGPSPANTNILTVLYIYHSIALHSSAIFLCLACSFCYTLQRPITWTHKTVAVQHPLRYSTTSHHKQTWATRNLSRS